MALTFFLHSNQARRISCRLVRTIRSLSQLVVYPANTLIDEHVTLCAVGLSARQPVTFFSQLRENNNRFAAYAHYVADNNGEIDLRTSLSTGGSFTGLEPMGLFWGMQQEEGQRRGIRLIKKDVTQPYEVKISLLDGHRSWESLNKETITPLCVSHCYRWYMDKGVRRVEVKDGNIRGALFIPKGPAPHPGLIEFFGAGGGLMDFRGALLASRGFITLSLAIFDYPEVPQNLGDVEFSYFEEAADWFSSRPDVRTGGVGVLGVSKGGEFAMLMGIHCPNIKAVISINGPPHLTFVDLKVKQQTLKGIPMESSRIVHKDGGMISRDAFQFTEDDVFPYHEMKANCLLIQGDDDQIYNPIHQQKIIANLDPEHRSKFTIVCYPGTGHLVEPPHAPICLQSWHKAVDGYAVWGGERKSHAEAQVQAWHKVLSFLRDNLPQLPKL